jgi:hypothetical protein
LSVKDGVQKKMLFRQRWFSDQDESQINVVLDQDGFQAKIALKTRWFSESRWVQTQDDIQTMMVFRPKIGFMSILLLDQDGC